MSEAKLVINPPEVGVERRAEERVVYRDLKVFYDGCADAVQVRSPDLTTHGMFINTPRNLAEGATLQLRFELARTCVIVHTRAEIRYCLPGVGAGVQFIGLPVYARDAIEKELAIIRREEKLRTKKSE